MDLKTLTLSVCATARRAGSFIRDERRQFRSERIEHKHAHDYVSYVDKESERLIVSELRQLLPEAGFITEEGSAGHGDEDYCWVVDPLDGTTNFIHRFPPYAVSIALMKGSDILIGVVYEVCADECFYAWQGGGAYVNGTPLLAGNDVVGNASKRCGKESPDCDASKRCEKESPDCDASKRCGKESPDCSSNALTDALLCLQLPYNSEAYKPVIERLIDRFYGRVASIRMMGSAAVALCYVAAGRLDGYAEKYIGQWDYMAGALIVKEAGGMVTDYTGSSHFTHGDSIVATNGLIHQDLLEAIRLS